MELQAYQPKVGDYVARGPARWYKTDADLFEDLASVWQRCSLQIHQLCEVNGTRYFHFLQPTQYLPGSKPMGEKELTRAFFEKHPYRKGAEQGYPYLITAGQELVRHGVKFHDLTIDLF